MKKLDATASPKTTRLTAHTTHEARKNQVPPTTTATSATTTTTTTTTPAAHFDRSTRSATSTIDAASLPALLASLPKALVGHEAIASVSVVGEHGLPSTEAGKRFTVATLDVRFANGSKETFTLPLVVDGSGRATSGLASEACKKALVNAIEIGHESFEAKKSGRAERGRRRPHVGGVSTTAGAAKARGNPAAGVGGVGGVAVGGALGAQLTKAVVDKSASKVLEGGAYDAHLQAALLARAVYGDDKAVKSSNPWVALVQKGYTTRERFEHVLEQARILAPADADAVVVEFFKNVWQTMEAQPKEIHAFHEALATKPRFSPVFYGYAQFIGVPDGKKEATFDDLAKALDVIQSPAGPASMIRGGGEAKGLGFQDVELLPFYQSPQKDGGYDISDHGAVDEARGGNAAYGRFLGESVKRGMRVTADLVANHVSNEHAWAKALLDGDTSMLSRFVVWDDAVKIGEREVDGKTMNIFLHQKGPDAGKVSHVWQIFPDNNPDTFIEAKVKGEDTHNVFASFMNPYQWDVNVASPEVFSDFLRIVGQFANMGQMGTRMDAIIHAGKKAGTFNMNNPESQAFMQLVKAFASHVAPGNTFLPEANLDWETAKKDWLSPEAKFGGAVENLSGDALISFDVHRAIWDSLLKGDKSAWIDAQNGLGDLPAHKSLLVYLGLHDETLIDDPKLRKELLARGFHDFAGRGVGDAPAALLNTGDKATTADRLAMAHVLLYTSKGHPAVYYRTVVGSDNNDAYFKQKTEDRIAAQVAAGEKPDVVKSRDTRDLDRGPVSLDQLEQALSSGYKPAVTVRALNALWEKNAAVRGNDVVDLKNADAAIVSLARHGEGDASLLQLVNLSGEKKTVTLDASELAQKLGWSAADLANANKNGLRDILAGEIAGQARDVRVVVDGAHVKIELAPYEAMFLEGK